MTMIEVEVCPSAVRRPITQAEWAERSGLVGLRRIASEAEIADSNLLLPTAPQATPPDDTASNGAPGFVPRPVPGNRAEMNEWRADIGEAMVRHGAALTGVDKAEDAYAATMDCLTYLAHWCDRVGLMPTGRAFTRAINAYAADLDDAPPAARTLTTLRPLADQ